ncbi:MAG TPA: GIY-YIG nuclease family protein [Stellaceae bacterium]|jgi:putative endonuclease|nr:GIY-YIG nuclease family protein [Stellaceae bacterium]
MNTDLRLLSYYVYLLASRRHRTFYLGVTNDLIRRIHEHKIKAVPGFSARFEVDRLVWCEVYDHPLTAIAREKEIKKWRRDWKIALIEADNPDWNDLFDAIAR